MNAVLARVADAGADAVSTEADVVLLGTGKVGRALLERLTVLGARAPGASLSLLAVANSREVLHVEPTAPPATTPRDAADLLLALSRSRRPRILIDATASDEIAARHPQWLANGVHVVTACKLGQGAGWGRWREIQSARALGGTDYGDSATVGAGLPLLRSLRDLRAGGDRIHAIAGVLSGSLAWLFDRFDGQRAFSDCVREAQARGYTEPDARDDLSGEDVRRKLLILARAAGSELRPEEVSVESLLTPELVSAPVESWPAALAALDGPLHERLVVARRHGQKLRYVARWRPGAARIGVEGLAADHPLASGTGSDNRVAIWSDRYREQPLLIQGPGAGAEVTAAALLDDVLRIARRHPRR